MAELATVARPYVEALFRVAKADNLGAWSELMSEIGQIAAAPDMKAVTDDPKLSKTGVAGIFLSTLKSPVSHETKELVDLLMTNERLSLLPEIAAQFHVLRNASEGAANIEITGVFPPEGALLAELVVTLEREFGKELRAHMSIGPPLIGGVRVQIGDEVLDTSMRARLTRMQSALTAA